jgi:hypothetical protein
MSDVTDQYVARSKRVAEDQYVSIRSAPSNTLRQQEWLVDQVSFIAGARSLNEQDLHQNLNSLRSRKQTQCLLDQN